MKNLTVDQRSLIREERWDFDFHEPPRLIEVFPPESRSHIRDVADVVKQKKDPTKEPELEFSYVDISSIDVETGEVARIQELTGSEAPSRARKLVSAYDIIISTCRPTRRAIAVIPEELHGQICSTGFSVIRAKEGINPLYLHFALRLDSTIEQFRKFSTGSSYPAILDSDVEKTLIPMPEIELQDKIVQRIGMALSERKRVINEANFKWDEIVNHTVNEISAMNFAFDGQEAANGLEGLALSSQQIRERIALLPKLEADEEDVDDSIIELDFEGLETAM